MPIPSRNTRRGSRNGRRINCSSRPFRWSGRWSWWRRLPSLTVLPQRAKPRIVEMMQWPWVARLNRIPHGGNAWENYNENASEVGNRFAFFAFGFLANKATSNFIIQIPGTVAHFGHRVNEQAMVCCPLSLHCMWPFRCLGWNCD